MTKEGWHNLVLQAVAEHNAGDSETLDLLVENLVQMEQAKQELRDKGYGVTGVSLLETVRLVGDSHGNG